MNGSMGVSLIEACLYNWTIVAKKQEGNQNPSYGIRVPNRQFSMSCKIALFWILFPKLLSAKWGHTSVAYIQVQNDKRV